LDDGTPMMSCGLCSKWQHIACHDLADHQAGRRRRNWDRVEFFCAQCWAKKAAVARPPLPQAQISTAGTGHTPTKNPYMTHSIANLAHASQYMNSTYAPSVPAVNGSMAYTHEPQVSSVRATAPPPAVPQHPPTLPVQAHQQHQSYAAPISFSHYQPQQRGFSSSTEPLYGPSSHTQPYGHPATHNQYHQYPVMNGAGQSYQTSQARWNNSSQRSTFEQGNVRHNAAGDMNAGRDSSIQPRVSGTLPPGSMHWQQPLHHSPPAIAGHNAAPQHPTQFRYHSNSYQPAPTS